MDAESEVLRLKWLLFAGVAFLVSMYYSWKELKFAVRGQTVDARMTRAYEATFPSRGGRTKRVLAVEYTFTDLDGTPRSERDGVRPDWPLPQADTVRVQYLPGVAGSSRLAGHSNAFAVWVFVGCLAWLGYSGYKLWREAADAVHGRPRKSRQ